MGIKGYVVGYQMKTKFKVLNELVGTQPRKVLNKFRMSGYQVRKVLKKKHG